MSFSISNNQNLPEFLWVLSEVTPVLAEECSSMSLPRILRRPYIGGGSAPTILSNPSFQTTDSSILKSYIFVGNIKTTRSFKNCPHPAKPTIPKATYLWKVYRKNKPCSPTMVAPKCLPGFELKKVRAAQIDPSCSVDVWECVRTPEVQTSSKCMKIDGTELICGKGQICKTNGSIVRNIGGINYRFNTGSCIFACPPVQHVEGTNCHGLSPTPIPAGYPILVMQCPAGYGAIESYRWVSAKGCIHKIWTCSKCPQ